jgi:hypothetical protein
VSGCPHLRRRGSGLVPAPPRPVSPVLSYCRRRAGRPTLWARCRYTRVHPLACARVDARVGPATASVPGDRVPSGESGGGGGGALGQGRRRARVALVPRRKAVALASRWPGWVWDGSALC